jgi:hypothetical protein
VSAKAAFLFYREIFREPLLPASWGCVSSLKEMDKLLLLHRLDGSNSLV